MIDDQIPMKVGALRGPSFQNGSAKRFRHWSLVICHLSFVFPLWSERGWDAEAETRPERAGQDLACPRFGPALTPPAAPSLIPDLALAERADRLQEAVRRRREREERVIQENLLRSEAEQRARAGPFAPEDRLRREDPGPANSPTGAIDTPSPAFTWIPIPRATSYTIRIERGDGWSLLEIAPVIPLTLSQPLPRGWRYRWFYRGRNEEAGAGPWCFGGAFDLGTDRLPAPELLEPKGRPPVGPTGRQLAPTPTFRWRAVPRADRYHLLVETADGGPVHEAWVESPSLVLPFGLELGERYRWRVSPWNAVEGEGWPSADEEFETAAPPLAAPTPLEPPPAPAGNPPTFAWTGVRGAVLYRLTVEREEGTLLLDTWTGETEYTPAQPLPPDAGYRWRVRGWNGMEGEGPVSPEMPLRTPAAGPDR